MQIHNITREHPNSLKKRVGRGGKRGKTSGRGTKGQKARAGHSLRPQLRDIIKKIPKQRGHGKNRARTVNDSIVPYTAVKISVLEASFSSGEKVTPMILLEKNLVNKKKGKVPQVKILDGGDLTKKLEISKCKTSKNAKEKIEKAGGKVL